MADKPNLNQPLADTSIKQPGGYVPGMIVTPSNPELGQLMGLFAGQILGPMFGAQNFVPHMSRGGIGMVDQYAMRHFQQQQYASAMALSTANNENVAARVLALRTLGTEGPVTQETRNQAENVASMLNNPFFKGIAGAMIGPETLEALMHGTKGDISQLHSATMRMGFYRADPSGQRRMGARAMEDFSRGVYAHLYEEGGDFDALAQEAEFAADADRRADSVRRLKRAARIQDADDIEVFTEQEFLGKVNVADPAVRDRIDDVYRTRIQGTETDTLKQAEAIAKSPDAARDTGLLGDRGMLVAGLRQEAEKMQLASMHGLMAGQVGQLQERLFQQGMLPQAIGNMAPADRVRLMAGDLNEETIRRLAIQEARRDLELNNKEYQQQSGNPAAQQRILEQNLGQYEQRITETAQAIKDFPADGKISDLEKLGGFEAIASNVDAQRTAAAVKKYAGAVDAVREIFGDSGNPNAPMPALLAALDQLTQGANFQMDAKNVEIALRQMQVTAREAGIGFEQMAGMSAQMGAMGQMLGLSPQTIMHNQINAMALIKTMREDGTFSRPRFGGMGQGEAQQLVGEKLLAGDASDNAKMMAAAAGIYATGKDSFDPNSEFALAMEGYLRGDGNYTFDGQQKNLFEIVGRQGPAAVMSLFQQTGAAQSELMTAFRSPMAMEKMVAGSGFQTMRASGIRMMTALGTSAPAAAAIKNFGEANIGSSLAGKNSAVLGDIAGETLTTMLVDTGELSPEEQAQEIAQTLPARLKEQFKNRLGLDDAEAERMANDAAVAMIGTGNDATERATQARQIMQYRNAADAVLSAHTDGQFTMQRFYVVFGDQRLAAGQNETARSRAVARQAADLGISHDSHPLARMSDELLRAATTGEKLSIQELMARTLNITPNAEIVNRYIEPLRPALEQAQQRFSEIAYTDTYVRNLAAQTAPASQAELQQLAAQAGITPESFTLYSADAYAAGGAAAAAQLLDTGTDEEIQQAYFRASGNTSGKTKLTPAEIKQILRGKTGDKRVAAAFQQQQAAKAFADYRKQSGNERLLTPAELAEKIITSPGGMDSVIGQLRPGSGGTEEELNTVRSFVFGVLGSRSAGVRRSITDAVAGQYGIEMNDDVFADLDRFMVGEKDDQKAQTALAGKVAELVRAGGQNVNAEQLGQVQEKFEAMRVAKSLDPASMGITTDPRTGAVTGTMATSVGDIHTQAATIQAGSVVLQGPVTQQQPAATPRSPTEAAAAAAAPADTAAATTAQTPDTKRDAPLPAPAPPPPVDAITPQQAQTMADAAAVETSGAVPVPEATPAAAQPAIESPPPPTPTAPLDTATTKAGPRNKHEQQYEATVTAARTQLANLNSQDSETVAQALRSISGNFSPQQMITAGFDATTVSRATQQFQQAPPATGSGQAAPLEITGTLSLTNLEEGVFVATNKGGRVLSTPGGVPVMAT